MGKIIIQRTVRRYAIRGAQKVFSVATRQMMGTITHVSTRAPIAALTFDDGPHPEVTPSLLGILERYQAHATFFMIGQAAQRYPELVRCVAQAGHALGNHSWDHVSFPLISHHERRLQIQACQRALTPYGHRFFRPPYGEQSVASRLDALCLGYKVIGWNVDAGDWWNDDASRMADLLVARVRPGSIILLHDAICERQRADRRPLVARQAHVDRESMLTAVTLFLERIATRFRFVTIPELLCQGRPQRQNWYKVTPAAG